MENNLHIVEKGDQYSISIFHNSAAKDLKSIIGPSFEKLDKYLADCNINQEERSYGYTAYHNMNLIKPDMEHLEVETGFLLNRNIKSTKDIRSNIITGRSYVSIIHIGSTNSIGKTYGLLIEWLQKNNHSTTGTIYEIYLNDPDTVKPEENQTQVLFPI
jgi:effector-binding domain-containing protein